MKLNQKKATARQTQRDHYLNGGLCADFQLKCNFSCKSAAIKLIPRCKCVPCSNDPAYTNCKLTSSRTRQCQRHAKCIFLLDTPGKILERPPRSTICWHFTLVATLFYRLCRCKASPSCRRCQCGSYFNAFEQFPMVAAAEWVCTMGAPSRLRLRLHPMV